MKQLFYILIFIAPLNGICQNLKGTGVWEKLTLTTSRWITSDSCMNNTFIIEKKIKSVTEVSIDSIQKDTIKKIIFTELYNKEGFLTDYISHFQEIKYTYDSANCSYLEVHMKRLTGMIDSEGELGSISGKECICKEYSRKGLLVNYSHERNGLSEHWHYEYDENDLVKSVSYYFNLQLIYRHAYFYEFYK